MNFSSPLRWRDSHHLVRAENAQVWKTGMAFCLGTTPRLNRSDNYEAVTVHCGQRVLFQF